MTWEDPSELVWERVEVGGVGSIGILRTRDELDQDELQELAELEARRVPFGFAPFTPTRKRTRKAKR